MKLIVDFDDVLFDTARFKDYFFKGLSIHGVNNVAELYAEERKKNRPFSLRNFIQYTLTTRGEQNEVVGEVNKAEEIYSELIRSCSFFVNQDMVDFIKIVGKQNCFIVTSGDDEFQMDKITRTGLEEFCQKVYIVPSTKKKIIEDLCTFFSSEVVIFTDDKSIFFEDIDMGACKNLKTVLYDESGLTHIQEEIAKAKIIEQA